MLGPIPGCPHEEASISFSRSRADCQVHELLCLFYPLSLSGPSLYQFLNPCQPPHSNFRTPHVHIKHFPDRNLPEDDLWAWSSFVLAVFSLSLRYPLSVSSYLHYHSFA